MERCTGDKMKKLNVLGSKVTVKIKKLENPAFAAEFNHDTNTITIQPDDALQFKSMLHELGHAYWHRAGLFQANRNAETEEIFCETFSNLISDNMIVLWQMFRKMK
jgi:Zn-dependent peptidase ImmA (M78 family)